MSASTEQQIIKQYQPLIRALIPYEQQNKLLEGLNKFTGRVPGNVRKIIKDEVLRLTSLTNAPADNSAFAEFPVFKFSHFGIEMRLDKVGARLLKKESELYQQRYTVGVFETITSSDSYQAHLKKENLKKIVDAFTIESQSLDDIHFGDDLAITPNFPVSSLEFEKGRSCTVSSLAYRSMVLESKRPPKVSSKDVFSFKLPEISGIPADTELKYVVGAVKFNQYTEKYETHFRLHPSTDPKTRAALKKYINMASFQQPLQRELECEKAMQDLERDRIVVYSPWVPLYLSCKSNNIRPVSVLVTPTNQQYSGGLSVADALTRKKLLPRIVRELATYSDVFVLTGSIETRQGTVRIAATLRELETAGILAPVVHLMNANETLFCCQCRLQKVDQLDKQKAFAIHDLVPADYPDLDIITHVVFYKNVTESLKGLVLTERQPMPTIPVQLTQGEEKASFSMLVDEDTNRRSEPRYLLEKQGFIKTGLLSTVPILVKDISSKGLCIELQEPLKTIEPELRVSVPELKLKAQKYEVVGMSVCKSVLRLRLPSTRDAVATGISHLVHKNISYFKTRDLSLIQRNNYRFVWELAVRYHPSASILCVTNRYLINRLKTLYQGKGCDDLHPFSTVENVVPMHGFFADRDADKPKSRLLADLFQGAITDISVVHCVRKSDNKLVYLPEQDFLYSAVRNNVQNHLVENKVELCVTKLDVTRCVSQSSPMTKKRLAQLSRIDKAMYDRFNAMQSSYTHVLYLTSESVLHSAILNAKLRPVKRKTT